MFTGKATYASGPSLPELAEDVSDILGIVSPHETPLLDALGDPNRAAHATIHEWLEDNLLPNTDAVDDQSLVDPDADTTFGVLHVDRFRAGDQVQADGSREVMLVTDADELDYQKQERLRELVRDLENCVINGVAASTNPEGDASTRRTMKGILSMLTTNVFSESGSLDEPKLNAALRAIWEQSSARIDTLVVNGVQKRKINSFITATRGYDARDSRFKDLVSTYESDFGVCRVVLCRWVPADAVLLLDRSRIDVLPLAGRSFHFKKLAATGDSDTGQLIGEYTLELRNENAHGVIRGLSTS